MALLLNNDLSLVLGRDNVLTGMIETKSGLVWLHE